MEQMYEIDKNVPLPVPRKRYSYPYGELQVGESFWVTGVKMASLCNLNLRQGKSLGRKFVCRKEGDGVRIWRVE
jgi:hypothetical protein